jgi:hypothetical protein
MNGGAFLKTQLQAFLLKTLNQKMHVLEVLFHSVIVDTYVIEAYCDKFM